MKKLTAILLLCCLITPFWLGYGWLVLSKQALRKEIKREILKGMDQEDLVQFTFTRETLQTKVRWEHAGEFEYQGRMYDVVSSDTMGHQLVFWCWPDDKETRINQQMRELVEQTAGQHPKQQQQTRTLLSLLQLPYLQDHFTWQSNPDDSNITQTTPFVAVCLSGFSEIHPPPPKTI
jgi:hypothetical protein